MYCKKCAIEVHGGAQSICPICNGPLDETATLFHPESGNVTDKQKLHALISNIDATVKQSLEIKDSAGGRKKAPHDLMLRAVQKAKADTETEKLETEKEQEAPFDLEKALSTEDTHLQNIAAVSAESVEKSASEFTHTKDILDKTLEEFVPEPAQQPVLNQNQMSGPLYKILIVFLVVIIAGATGYYLFFKEPEYAKRSFVLPRKIATLRVPQDQIDKKIEVPKQTVQVQKATDDRQTEPGKKDASQPMAETSPLTASAAYKGGTPPSVTRENKPIQRPAEEKKIVVPPQQETSVHAMIYCVNVGSFKLKENAAVVIKDLQKKDMSLQFIP
jgi:hypothetical protein